MKLTGWSKAFSLAMAAFSLVAVAPGQQQQTGNLTSVAGVPVFPSEGAMFTVQGTSPERKRLVRSQIQVMQPAVLPSRVIFVPHWQYIYATKGYHLHVPSGMTSKMFTHLASRSVYIDTDRYGGDEWLGHWMAHELGHLEANNADENEAEKKANKYRRRLTESTTEPR
jgi:hypothetical protein